MTMKEKKAKSTLLAIAQTSALAAGRFLAKQTGRKAHIDAVSKHDLKLKTDKQAEAMIVKELSKRTSFPILSEEAGWLGARTNGSFWVVDPIDGTFNFYRGIPIFCVSIALFDERDQPILGVIYDVCRQEMFAGIVGKGVWLNGRAVHTSQTANQQAAVLLTGFPSGITPKQMKEVVELGKSYCKLRWIGSAALSLAYVACGRGDIYHERGIKIWDVAAGLALVLAAGGHIHTKKTKQPFGYDVWASNSFLSGLKQ